MCMFSKPQMPAAPELPPERAAAKAPDRNAARESTTARVSNRVRSGANTILTSGSGVTTPGMTEKKTLLGQ